jgi:hypothetical protein
MNKVERKEAARIRRDDAAQEAVAYLQHIRGLLPGWEVPVRAIHNVEPGPLDGWADGDLALLIEQGRLQLARQRSDLENARVRAQFLFTVAIGAAGLIAASFAFIQHNLIAFIGGFLAIALVGLSALGAAAVVVARKELREVDTTILTLWEPPLRRVAADAYAASISAGENTLAASITVYRDAVGLLILGLAIEGLAAALALFA